MIPTLQKNRAFGHIFETYILLSSFRKKSENSPFVRDRKRRNGNQKHETLQRSRFFSFYTHPVVPHLRAPEFNSQSGWPGPVACLQRDSNP
jgi:hypothetical protein